jgi:hypothetical protein
MQIGAAIIFVWFVHGLAFVHLEPVIVVYPDKA